MATLRERVRWRVAAVGPRGPRSRAAARRPASSLGVGTRIAAVTGTLMLVLMWAAELPLANNPFMDEHLIYAVVLADAGATLGLGDLPIVRRTAWLT